MLVLAPNLVASSRAATMAIVLGITVAVMDALLTAAKARAVPAKNATTLLAHAVRAVSPKLQVN